MAWVTGMAESQKHALRRKKQETEIKANTHVHLPDILIEKEAHGRK